MSATITFLRKIKLSTLRKIFPITMVYVSIVENVLLLAWWVCNEFSSLTHFLIKIQNLKKDFTTFVYWL